MGTTRIHKSQKLFIGSVFLLTAIGLVILASTSVPLSQENFGTSYYYLKHQALYGFGVGIVLFFIFRKIPTSTWKRLALPTLLLAILLLLLVFVPGLGYEAGGARRWLSMLGFSFQPSEFAKLAMILYLSAWLDKRRDKLGKTSTILAFLALVAAITVPVFIEPDFGTTALLIAIAITLYFAAGAKFKGIFLLALVALVITAFAVYSEPYRFNRFLTFLSPTTDVHGSGYQLNQALIAIGSGGLFGKGLGQSVQKFEYLPESVGDSIFAIVGEEFGFVFTTALLILFVIFITSGLKMARNSRSIFGSLICVGVVTWIAMQAFINIAGITGLLPFTGMPLPFISYGGSALALELAAVGIASSAAKG